jgi:hypothetical protein
MPTTGDFPLQLSLPTGADPVDVSVLNANFEKVNDYAGENDTDIAAITANSWVSTSRIADSAVTTVKIANANVTAAKLEATLDLTGKTVSVAAPSAGAHATTKTYVDAQDAATLVAAKAYTDITIPSFSVLTSGSWSSSAPFGNSITTTGFRKLILSITTTAYSGMTGLNVAFTGVTGWDTVTTTFGSTSLTTAAGSAVLTADVTAVGNVQVFEIDYPGAAVKKTLFARGNLRFVNGRSTNAAAITAFLCTPFGATGASGTYEVIGVR